MKIKILIIMLSFISNYSYCLNIKSDKICSQDNSNEIKYIDMLKMYKTSLYKNFYDVLVLKKFPLEAIPILFCITKLESNFNTNAININKNGSVDLGLFQINQVWRKECHSNINRTEDNIDCARIILKKQGLNAWTTYRKYKYICLNAIKNLNNL